MFRSIPMMGHVFEGCEIVDYTNTARIHEKKDFVSGLVFFLMCHVCMCVFKVG